MLNRFQSGDGPYNKSLLCDYKRASCGPSFEALAAGRSKQSVSEGEGRWHLVTGFLPPPRLGFQLGDILHRPPVNRCLTYQWIFVSIVAAPGSRGAKHSSPAQAWFTLCVFVQWPSYNHFQAGPCVSMLSRQSWESHFLGWQVIWTPSPPSNAIIY